MAVWLDLTPPVTLLGPRVRAMPLHPGRRSGDRSRTHGALRATLLLGSRGRPSLQTHHGGQLGSEGAGVGLQGAVESGGSDGEGVGSG
ncbi:hypothetical protein GCM10010094_89770 [Streptomyces flaveus]|uniref:Uncharacterized protein n=1 Tax=Streptomyces flaveus TaxID=66370 RepID=A0A917VU71_9ACTN|nr:hypothetical protein GCM10010094_89770 [Streptomyces flaveus]